MLRQIYKKVKYASFAVKIGGVSYLMAEIKRRAYRKETFIGLEKNLAETGTEISSSVEYSLRRASPKDIEQAFRNIRKEGWKEFFDLIQRKWFYESGFKNCYIAIEEKNQEICHMVWIISRQDNNSQSRIFQSSFPWLGTSDVQFEHFYTFGKYRGNKVMSSVMNKLCRIARDNGSKRAIVYILADNIASLKGCYSVGFQKFDEVHRTKFVFSTRYRRIIVQNDGQFCSPSCHSNFHDNLLLISGRQKGNNLRKVNSRSSLE